jgi:hypothetical protein
MNERVSEEEPQKALLDGTSGPLRSVSVAPTRSVRSRASTGREGQLTIRDRSKGAPMRIRSAAVLATALILTLGAVPPALAAEVFQVRDRSAFASFTDFQGCIGTFVFLAPSEFRSHSPFDPNERGSGVLVNILIYDVCVDEVINEAFGVIGVDEFRVQGNLKSATLTATEFICSEGFCNDISIDMTWSGIGGITTQKSRFHFNAPGVKINSHFNGRTRQAVASGTVLVGETNVTPEPSNFAQIASLKSGTVVIEA